MAKAAAAMAMLSVLEAPGVKGLDVLRLPCDATDDKDAVTGLVQRIVTADDPPVTGAFNVLNLTKVTELFAAWRRGLKGSVSPYYAVKCNANPALLGAMAALGAGFDCASPAEMDAVLSLGVTPDRIIYANPCKPESHIQYAASVGVSLATFDSADELDKVRRIHPGCRLLLRLKVPEAAAGDDGDAALQDLGTKYGARAEEVAPLLRAARSAGLTVSGVSFHVGTGVSRVGVYDAAVEAARAAFDAAAALGLPPMHVLDIGGGFKAASTFQDACDVINAALARHFGDIMHGGGDGDDLQVIGEPGRYFAETTFTLAARVFGKRARGEAREYWMDDGFYGTLCCIHIDSYMPRPVPVALATGAGDADADDDGQIHTHPSTVFGPTLDSLDVVVTGYHLPELRIGDWLVFHDVGAYSTVASSNFNGFSASDMKTYVAVTSIQSLL